MRHSNATQRKGRKRLLANNNEAPVNVQSERLSFCMLRPEVNFSHTILSLTPHACMFYGKEMQSFCFPNLNNKSSLFC